MIFRDELLHSFLFRTQKVYGFSDFRNIISNVGLLRFDIFPLAEMLSLYRCYDNQSLYDVISRNGLPLVNRIDAYSPASMLSSFLIMRAPEYKKHQLRNLKSKYNISQINFCSLCISESIKNNGVGYIKNSWLSQSCCFQHNLPLQVKILTSYDDTVQFIMAVISGGICSDVFQYKNNHSVKTVNSVIPAPVFLMPCMLSAFNLWAEKNKKEIAEKTYRNFGIKTPLLFLSSIQYIVGNKQLLNHFYSLLTSEDIAGFNLFLSENFERKMVKLNPHTHEMFAINIMKTTEFSCRECPRKYNNRCTHHE